MALSFPGPALAESAGAANAPNAMRTSDTVVVPRGRTRQEWRTTERKPRRTRKARTRSVSTTTHFECAAGNSCPRRVSVKGNRCTPCQQAAESRANAVTPIVVRSNIKMDWSVS